MHRVSNSERWNNWVVTMFHRSYFPPIPMPITSRRERASGEGHIRIRRRERRIYRLVEVGARSFRHVVAAVVVAVDAVDCRHRLYSHSN